MVFALVSATAAGTLEPSTRFISYFYDCFDRVRMQLLILSAYNWLVDFLNSNKLMLQYARLM